MNGTIEKVTIVGAGYMGGGIAQRFALAGYHTTIVDVDPQAGQRALERLLTEAREFEDEGLFAPGSTATIEANVRAAATVAEAVAEADFIEEAVFEQREVKREVLAAISRAARPEAIIGTNTSSIPVRELDDAVLGPERFLTVHFSNPAPFIPGVELVAGVATDPQVLDAVEDVLERVGAVGARIADSVGMVLNRLQYALFKEASMIVDEGIATAADVDTIVRTTFGFRLGFFGPFAIADQAGLPVYQAVFEMFEKAYGERFATPALLREAVANGAQGVKNQRGLRGEYDDDAAAATVAYRNRAYARMAQLLAELGPAPRSTR